MDSCSTGSPIGPLTAGYKLMESESPLSGAGSQERDSPGERSI
jgi:hypothetical protein